MKTLFAVVLVLIATSVMASPYLVCDPQTGVTKYQITGSITATVPAQTDGSIRYDLAETASGTNVIQVKACVTDSFGEVCSAASPFEWSRAIQPNAPTGLKLVP